MTDAAGTNTAGSNGERPMTFTEAVASLDKDGFDSRGFGIDDGEIVCLDCGAASAPDTVKVGGLLSYEMNNDAGLVLVLRCPNCDAKGMLFAGPDMRKGPDGPLIEGLATRARG